VRAAPGSEHGGGPTQGGEVGTDEPFDGIGFAFGFGEAAAALGKQPGGNGRSGRPKGHGQLGLLAISIGGGRAKG